jgi:hypothetical protein
VETIAEAGIPVLAVAGGWKPGLEAIADAVVAQSGGERAVLDTGHRFPRLRPDFNETLAAFLSNAELRSNRCNRSDPREDRDGR